MRCWSCARVARRKRTLDSLSEQPPRYRPRYRLRPGLYAACLQPVSAECCKPHFSVQPADGLTHLFRRALLAPAHGAAVCQALVCSLRAQYFLLDSVFRADSERLPRLGHAGKLALGARGHGHERGLRAFGSRADRGQVLAPATAMLSRALASSAALAGLRHCRRYARQRRIRSLARPLLSQLIIKLRFRQGKRQDLGPAPAEPGCQEHDLQERALAAARQPSPAFQPPAWPRGTPPTVCPSGP